MIKLEAENAQLMGYRVESNSKASGGKLISFAGGSSKETGTASFSFSGTPGTYDIYLAYFDENDGKAKLETYVGSSKVAETLLDQDLGSDRIDNNLVETKVASVFLKPGETIQVKGFENASEHARLDYIQLVPSSVTPIPSPTPIPTASTGAIRINVGGSQYKDTQGQVWSADKYFTGGKTATTTQAIADTTLDPLYQSERYAQSLSYDIPVTNGTYDIGLALAEIYFNAAGERIFDITVEGKLIRDDLDIYAQAGNYKALNVLLEDVVVKDGVLDIDLKSSVNNAKLAAIEVLPNGLARSITATPTPTPIPTPTPSPIPTPTPSPIPTPIPSGSTQISGELKQWHPVTLTFDGPEVKESDTNNPFRNYRLDVTFTKGGKSFTVPGFYAADGNAGETSANSGNKWRVHFTPDETGTWNYSVNFRRGTDVAMSSNPNSGEAVSFHGRTGSFAINTSDKTGRDFRAKGRLEHNDEHYLRFAGSGEYFIKGGADSPENFLGYHEFDNTYDTKGNFLHKYEPHLKDWQSGNPTWQNGKGKGIIGALNYLASEGMNSVYFLTYNTDGGDGGDVFPWVTPQQRDRYDVSKLDQWNKVFSHMNQSGLMMHVVTQETENDQGLNNGELGPERRLYYRELVARFGHHLGLQWNIGEENTNTTQQRKDFANYIQALDPYDHPIVIHTYPGQQESVYEPLIGEEAYAGTSLQISSMSGVHSETLKWVNRSAASGKPWIVALDEIGPAGVGVKPDADDPSHDGVRKNALWGNLMAGGAGVEWYFGYSYAHNDLNAEDWRSRDNMWDQTRYALEFFQKYLPFTQMKNNNRLTSVSNDYVLAAPGNTYAVYLPNGGTTNINLPNGNYMVNWYNPREGGALQTGSVKTLSGGTVSIGQAPSDTSQDWVALIRNSNSSSRTLSLRQSDRSTSKTKDKILGHRSEDGMQLVGKDDQLAQHSAQVATQDALTRGFGSGQLNVRARDIEETMTSMDRTFEVFEDTFSGRKGIDHQGNFVPSMFGASNPLSASNVLAPHGLT
jgi:hypothetical protein